MKVDFRGPSAISDRLASESDAASRDGEDGGRRPAPKVSPPRVGSAGRVGVSLPVTLCSTPLTSSASSSDDASLPMLTSGTDPKAASSSSCHSSSPNPLFCLASFNPNSDEMLAECCLRASMSTQWSSVVRLSKRSLVVAPSLPLPLPSSGSSPEHSGKPVCGAPF